MPKPDALLCVLCGEWRERESASFDTTVQEKGREEETGSTLRWLGGISCDAVTRIGRFLRTREREKMCTIGGQAKETNNIGFEFSDTPFVPISKKRNKTHPLIQFLPHGNIAERR